MDHVAVDLSHGVGTITLARPPVNALATQTWQELGQAIAQHSADSQCRVVVVSSGLDTIFSAGADVKELPMPPAQDEKRQRLTRRVMESVRAAPVPVLCAIPGPALGGGAALAAMCDIRFAGVQARFGLPEITVGRLGGARYLMRLLPQGVVRHMYFTGEPIDAELALRFGLVEAVLPDAASLRAHTAAVAAQIAEQSPTAIRLGKEVLNLCEEMDLQNGYAVEQQFSLRLARTPDAAEAARAFRAKTKPRWPSTEETSGGLQPD
jgi:enoyl-CoA hydratase